jgi:hypothetical protein
MAAIVDYFSDADWLADTARQKIRYTPHNLTQSIILRKGNLFSKKIEIEYTKPLFFEVSRFIKLSAGESIVNMLLVKLPAMC